MVSARVLRPHTPSVGTLDPVKTRDISTSDPHTACDVCGRTLLRGERWEIYLHGGERRSVCELCKTRALHEGWVREGTLPDYNDGNARSERRRSLLGRLRARREAAAALESEYPPDEDDFEDAPPPEADPSEPTPTRRQRRAPRPVPAARQRQRQRDREQERTREPRHVRAVPTSPEQRTAAAADVFNGSEHIRTVAGVARSLGLPWVSVRPSAQAASMVNLVVSWELCWYRYEVDLSEEDPAVRLAGQGYELDELEPTERTANAAADEYGRLVLPS